MAALTPLAGLATTLFNPAAQSLTLGSVLGGLATTAAGAYIDNAADAARSKRQQQQSLAQLQQRQALEQQTNAQKAALERQKIQTAAAEAAIERRNALKRAVARSNASFAGRGISTRGGGSSDAILLGLFEESETDRAQREELDRLRTTALDQSLTQTQQKNLLELSQLQERYKLKNRLF